MAENILLIVGVVVAGVLAGIIGLICSSYSDLHYYQVRHLRQLYSLRLIVMMPEVNSYGSGNSERHAV